MHIRRPNDQLIHYNFSTYSSTVSWLKHFPSVCLFGFYSAILCTVIIWMSHLNIINGVLCVNEMNSNEPETLLPWFPWNDCKYCFTNQTNESTTEKVPSNVASVQIIMRAQTKWDLNYLCELKFSLILIMKIRTRKNNNNNNTNTEWSPLTGIWKYEVWKVKAIKMESNKPMLR